MTKSWEEYWDVMLSKKGGSIPNTIKMSGKAFERMQKQAYSLGLDRGFERGKGFSKKPTSTPSELFRGSEDKNVADLMDMFGMS